MTVIVLTLLAAAAFFISSQLVSTGLGSSTAFHHFSVVIAAGILLGVTFVDLIPDTFEELSSIQAALSIAGGFLALYLVETLTSGHTHHHEPHAGGHGDHGTGGHAHAHAHSHAPELDADGCVPKHAMLPFLIGLGLHNFADGIVIGASYESSDAAASGVTVGILIHQIPVGLSFGAVLVASGIAARAARRDSAFIAAMITLGAMAVLAIPGLDGDALGTLVGAAAGAILYIATGHLLPEAHSEERRPGLAAAFSVSLLATVLIIGSMHAG